MESASDTGGERPRSSAEHTTGLAHPPQPARASVDRREMNTVTDRSRERLASLDSTEEARVEHGPAADRREPAAPQQRASARLAVAIEHGGYGADHAAMFAQAQLAAAAPGATAPAVARTPAQVAPDVNALSSPTLGSARETAMQQRLDAFRDRFSGPYHVAGQTVTAGPMFRMNGGMNGALLKAHAGELAAICAKAGVPGYAGLCQSGRPSPEQLVKVTQALLDAGKLPPADAEHPTLTSRIRIMQWTFGIGVDCAGYTQQAAAAAHAGKTKAFDTGLMSDIFTHMGKDARFERVEPQALRAGDVIHLDNPRPGEVGHNVIVREHTTLTDAQRTFLLNGRSTPEARELLKPPAEIHVIRVDSSWGAGEGSDFGGFRRDTWLYDATSRRWACFTPITPAAQAAGERPALHVPPHGPQGEVVGGAYRPKEPR